MLAMILNRIPSKIKGNALFGFSSLTLSLSLIVFLTLALPRQAFCAQVTLAWDPEPLSSLAGYTLHYGTVSKSYSFTIDAGSRTSATITGLTEGITYYFAATAYDISGNESAFSNEVAYTVPSTVNNGKATIREIFWRNTATGQNMVWYMNGTTMTNSAGIYAIADQTWTIVGTGDFNNDGKPDILWRNTATGQNVVWYMDGANLNNWADIYAIADQTWTIVGTGDFNNDGKTDILWRNTATGSNVVWYMDGVTMTNWAALPANTDLNWKIVGR
jgi:hypothetical protein